MKEIFLLPYIIRINKVNSEVFINFNEVFPEVFRFLVDKIYKSHYLHKSNPQKQKLFKHIKHVYTLVRMMKNMTLSVPDELKTKMDKFKEINWSEVARQAFVQKMEDMELLKKLKKKSRMTKADAIKLGAELNKKLSKRWNL